MTTNTKSVGKILVVDDEPLVRAQIGQTMCDLGHEVVEAASGEEALQLAESERPDIILLDLAMPGLSGIEVCKQLRDQPATQDCRIIVVSGMDARRALEESIIAGADDFLAKPVDSVELSVRVRSMLRVRNIHDAERRVEAYVQQMHSLRANGKE